MPCCNWSDRGGVKGYGQLAKTRLANIACFDCRVRSVKRLMSSQQLELCVTDRWRVQLIADIWNSEFCVRARRDWDRCARVGCLELCLMFCILCVCIIILPIMQVKVNIAQIIARSRPYARRLPFIVCQPGKQTLPPTSVPFSSAMRSLLTDRPLPPRCSTLKLLLLHRKSVRRIIIAHEQQTQRTSPTDHRPFVLASRRQAGRFKCNKFAHH